MEELVSSLIFKKIRKKDKNLSFKWIEKTDGKQKLKLVNFFKAVVRAVDDSIEKIRVRFFF